MKETTECHTANLSVLKHLLITVCRKQQAAKSQFLMKIETTFANTTCNAFQIKIKKGWVFQYMLLLCIYCHYLQN